MSAWTDEIKKLKNELGAVILAHNYVNPEIQDIADFLGDSLELSFKARDSHAKVILFCGVRFMAETAKLLSPDSIVLIPEPEAGCPMADMASAEAVKEMRKNKPDAVFVAYVNTTAAVKAHVDICCTSGNVEKVLKSIPAGKEIVFLPDRNLGGNMNRKMNRNMCLWEGCCPVHDAVTPEAIQRARQAHPGAKVMVHPECRPEVTALADFALSTAGMLKTISASAEKEFIVGTETGILYRMQRENPGKNFYPLEPQILCENMKKITLEKVRDCLKNLAPRIELSPEIMRDAVKPIHAMMKLG